MGWLGKSESKSLWQDRSRTHWTFFCPNCKCERHLPFRPRPATPRHVIQVALTALVLTVAAWPICSWKGIVSFIPLWIGFEVIYRSRVRAALSCQACGFDPYLYLTDVKRARKEIESHWRRKFAEKGIPYPEPAAESVRKNPSTNL